MTDALRVGLVGAGPWARAVHAPLLAAGPETTLTGVWARRPQPAQTLASAHGARAYTTVEELLDDCEAVAFAVPPDVQASLAPGAAAAGRHLLLEKPLALDLAGAERIAAAVADAGVGSVVLLTNRFASGTRQFLDEARQLSAFGARGCFIAGAAVGAGGDASPWRRQYGGLFDVGPHVIDLLEAALGTVVPGSVRAHASPGGWTGVLLEHEGGAVSEAALTINSVAQPPRLEVEVFAVDAMVALSGRTSDPGETLATVRREFAAAARGVPHPCDAAHGLHLQRLIMQAVEQIG